MSHDDDRPGVWCSSCGAGPTSGRYCGKCGRDLGADLLVPSSSGSRTRTTWWIAGAAAVLVIVGAGTWWALSTGSDDSADAVRLTTEERQDIQGDDTIEGEELAVPATSVATLTTPPSSTESANVTTVPPTSPAPSTTATAPPETPPPTTVAPADALATMVAATGLVVETPIADHSCGSVVFVSGSGPPHLREWKGSEWREVGSSTMASGAADLEVTDRWVTDVTGDGQPEVLAQFYSDGAMRPFGGMLFAGNGDCTWRWIPTVDSCGSHGLYEGFSLDPQYGLIGSGFSGGCSLRESVGLRWIAAHEILLAEAMGGVPTCPEYEFRLDLPLFVCTEGWPVSMVQEALLASGFDVDQDGFYGPGTQLAVFQYQASRGLPVDGLVDEDTWTSMHPPGGPYFPDFDGDGVSSPREIGSATGATEYGGDW